MTDLKAFRRVCYDAARQTGGEVAEFRFSNEPAPNFHQGIIAYRDRTLAVVCVRDISLLAVAVPRGIELAPTRESGPPTFVDLPELAAALAEAPDFRLFPLRSFTVQSTLWSGRRSTIANCATGNPTRWAKPHSTTGTSSKITHALLPRSERRLTQSITQREWLEDAAGSV